MLQLIRNNSPFTVLILLILTILLKLQALVHPVAPMPLAGYYVYDHLLHWFNVVLGNGAFAYTFLSLVMVFGQALYLNAITIRHRLFYKPTYIPAFCYLLLTSFSPEFNFFSPSLLVNWCLLAAFDIMMSFPQSTHPRKYIFNAGFILSLAALVQFSASIYILLLIMGLVLLRSFNVGEWLVGLLGVFTPVYFFTGILFLNDQLPEFLKWPQVGISLPRQIHNPVYLLGSVSGIIILVASGLYVMQGQMPKSTIYVRRSWGVVTSMWITSLLVAVFTDLDVKAAWLVALPALSLIIAQPLYLEKSKRFSNFIFYFFLALVIFSQVAINK